MKTKTFTFTAVAFYFHLHTLSASIVVIDDFTSGPYNIGSSSLSSNTSSITSLVADSRRGAGTGTQEWQSSVNTTNGLLFYSVTGAPAPGQRLSITYSSDSDTLNLIGFTHFVFSVDDLIGGADLFVLYRGSSNQIFAETPIDIDSSGDFYIPFSFMGVSDPFSPSSVVFRVIPTSDDFSITLSSIGVIPEPSTAIMIALGASTLFLRRRRKS
jgi:hypothetical protein